MSKPETISIDEVEYIRKDSIKPTVAKIEGTPIGQYCIVRCRDAGVWAGTVVTASDRNVQLTDARRLWSWEAKKGHTLSAVAAHGIKDGKIPTPVDVWLTEACEIIPCSSESKKSIQSHAIHNE